MPTVTIPVTTYQIRKVKPTTRYGSPAALTLRTADSRIMVKATLDRVPLDGVISSAVLRFYAQKAKGVTVELSARPSVTAFKPSVTWQGQPTRGAVIDTTAAEGGLSVNEPVDLTLTTWALTRSRTGLVIDVDVDSYVWFHGSSAARNKPVLLVTYTIPAETPGGLRPAGGWVSVPSPILSYAGDEDMTEQRIEFSLDGGDTVSFTADWHAATSGRYDPALHPGSPALTAGQEIMWRATTNGPDGYSAPAPWVEYGYQPLPGDFAVVNPGASSADGSPPFVWSVTGQSSYKVDFYGGDKLLDTSGWDNAPATRDWTPDKGVAVPDGIGRFEYEIKDAVTPRVAAEDAPTSIKGKHTFVTTLVGVGAPIDTIEGSYEEPVVTITGTRLLGIPDEVSLFRDGVQVPVWDEEGNAYMWAPGPEFFDGTAFTLRDYTAPLRGQHTWEVRLRVNGVVSDQGPTFTAIYVAKSAWLVNPRTDERVEVCGADGLPVVSQDTSENAIVHVPINGGPLVEPKRRRLTRLTKSGGVEGSVQGADVATLEEWVEADSGSKYRLVFGRVNWSVILGDYSPVELLSYDGYGGPDRVNVALTWMQRLADV
jgi:hypothetical protein